MLLNAIQTWLNHNYTTIDYTSFFFFILLWLLKAPIQYYALYYKLCSMINIWYQITRKIRMFGYSIFHNHEICRTSIRISLFKYWFFMAVIIVRLTRLSMPMNSRCQTHNYFFLHFSAMSIEKLIVIKIVKMRSICWCNMSGAFISLDCASNFVLYVLLIPHFKV